MAVSKETGHRLRLPVQVSPGYEPVSCVREVRHRNGRRSLKACPGGSNVAAQNVLDHGGRAHPRRNQPADLAALPTGTHQAG